MKDFEHGLKLKRQFESVLATAKAGTVENAGNTCNPTGSINETALRPGTCLGMRTLGRYGFILLGLPNIIGFAVATILGGMLVPVVPAGKRPTLLCVAEM